MSDPIDLSDFTGWLTFAELANASVPRDPGVYLVVRPTDDPPQFRDLVPYRGDPAVAVADLEEGWVPGAWIVYIGKADGGVKRDGLHRRLRQFRRYGDGGSARHSGGRRIWQLADHRQLCVAWRVTTEAEVPADVEADLIEQFRAHYGVRPFANRRD